MSGSCTGSAVTSDEAGRYLACLADHTHVLVGVSGGPDSVALLALLAAWVNGPGRPALSAATVDHGLRPDSGDEARAVGDLCRRLDISHAVLEWTGDKPATGVQAAARSARYGLLLAHGAAIGADVLVTAHTLDDQAETVMMRLSRGSGPAGLAGMRPLVMRGTLAHRRPLLGVAKARLIATCRAQALAFVVDPANGDPRFTRSRWRRLLPLLAAEGLTAERLGRLADRAAQIETLVEARAAAVLAEARLPDGRCSASVIFAEPADVTLRALAMLVLSVAPAAEDGHLRLERLERLHADIGAALAAGLRLGRTLAGTVLKLGPDGILSVVAEKRRNRGRSLKK